MKPNTSPLERAFELARSGSCRNTSDVKKILRAEGYPIETLTGNTLLRQLRALIQQSVPETTPPAS
jgi:hypothetical protein